MQPFQLLYFTCLNTVICYGYITLKAKDVIRHTYKQYHITLTMLRETKTVVRV